MQETQKTWVQSLGQEDPLEGDLTCWDSVFGEPRSDVTWKHLFQVEGDVRGASLAFMRGEDWVE